MGYKINYIGHCLSSSHDKIWGYVTVGEGNDSQLYNFWGRRGKAIAFQRHAGGSWDVAYDLRRKAEEKSRPGRKSGSYRAVNIDNIERLIPGFIGEFETQFIAAKLTGQFRGTPIKDEWD